MRDARLVVEADMPPLLPGPLRGSARSAQVEDEVVAAVRDSVVRFDDQAIRDIVRIVRATIRRVGGE